MTIKIAFTGHRPNKIPGGWDGGPERDELVSYLICALRDQARKHGPSELITGGALGWDQVALEAGLKLGDMYTPTKIVVAEPFRHFWIKWRPEQIEFYHYLKYSTTLTHTITISDDGYSAWKMQRRNQYMVDNCDELWAFWDGGLKGGTANCIKYAQDKNVKIRNIYDEYRSI